MAKTTQAVTIAVCDRCKREGDTGDATGRQQWGEMHIGYKGHSGGRTVQGDAGGINHKGTAWLCMTCTDAFLSFLKNRSTTGADHG